MAEDTVKHRVYNKSQGPRGIAGADGRIVTVMPGEVSDFMEFRKADVELAKRNGELEFQGEKFSAPSPEDREEEEGRNETPPNVRNTSGFARPTGDKIPPNSLSAESAKAAENFNKADEKSDGKQSEKK